ncbi:hypothetical protein [Brevibacillus dissolubilis]|uniref:hypothetical protein n=1 Tax=Brevibacillus dissolubilis TaxID=1844116 RepID=UPI00111721C8|nr:hypothetical protein [Brevibacillus dissolubilis]
MSTDATHAYRGYRLQALYTLYRILKVPVGSQLVFQPEGNEDLTIYDEALKSQEVIQIKAYSTPLTLSNFEPQKPLSFFNRIAPQIKTNPDMQVKIFSFGLIGPELQGALNGDNKNLNSVAKKISKHGFTTQTEARLMLSRITAEQMGELELLESVFAKLKEMATGVDPERAFEMLNFWLYICSENKQRITREDVIGKINSVGRFLSERAAHHKEWGTVIVPIEDVEISEDMRIQLTEEFYQGVSTRYEHILSNLDLRRTDKLNKISELFGRKRVVFIHGASGQGKSTLAYRFLKDYLPKEWRFRIQCIQDKKHALSLATALIGHANAMGIPLFVYLDVSPADIDWIELVRQLSTHPLMRILVTVREEDWKKASVTGYEFSFEEIDLALTKEEALNLYHSFVENKGLSTFLNFDEAWERFGGEGPLLEFVYLVSQGTTLRERLHQQIMYLEKEVETGVLNPSILHLLYLVAVASAFESRIEVKPLIKYLDIKVPGTIFRRLENEYLIRVTNQSMLVQGLHPIRSEILVSQLGEVLFVPWDEAAQSCLALIHEEDVEGFLLYSFSRRQDETDKLLKSLSEYTPYRWTGYAGVVRSLIWLGLIRYIQENEEFINDVLDKFGDGFIGIVDIDITNSVPGSSNLFLNAFQNLIPKNELNNLFMLKSRQTSKDRVFDLVKNWLITRKPCSVSTMDENDWRGLAYCGYWLGKLNLICSLSDIFQVEFLDQALLETTTETLSYLTYGFYSVQPDTFMVWLHANKELLIEKYCNDTFTLHLEEDGSTIRSHFVIEMDRAPQVKPLSEKENTQRDNFVHSETLQRLDLLHRLFPYYDAYATKGYGHRLVSLPVEMDESVKNIKRENLGNEWSKDVNGTFRRLIVNKIRKKTWFDYVNQIMDFRRTIAIQCKELEDALKEYFRRSELDLPHKRIDIDQFDKLKNSLKKIPDLPKVAVDEWGFAEDVRKEQKERNNGTALSKKTLANERYISYNNTLRSYTSSFSNFFNQCFHALLYNPFVGRGQNLQQVEQIAKEEGIRTDVIPLTMVNLADACTVLFELQREFNSHFKHLVDEKVLRHLEQQEKHILTRFTPIWYYFTFHPKRIVRNSSEALINEFEHRSNKFIKQLKEELKCSSNEARQLSLIAKDVKYVGKNAICIRVNHKGIPIDQDSLNLVYKAVNNALSLEEDNRLQRFTLETKWQYIIVVPLLDGKKVNKLVWQIPFLTQLAKDDYESKWWNYFPVEITEEWLLNLNVCLWDHPRTEIVNSMTMELNHVMLLLNHVIDVSSLNVINPKMREAYQLYVSEISERIIESIQKAFSSLGIVFKVITEYENNPSIPDNLVIIFELAKGIVDVLDIRTDNPGDRVFFESWLSRIERAYGMSGQLAMYWTYYVMEDA